MQRFAKLTQSTEDDNVVNAASVTLSGDKFTGASWTN
jgi:hypothetical protein